MSALESWGVFSFFFFFQVGSTLGLNSRPEIKA